MGFADEPITALDGSALCANVGRCCTAPVSFWVGRYETRDLALSHHEVLAPNFSWVQGGPPLRPNRFNGFL